MNAAKTFNFNEVKNYIDTLINVNGKSSTEYLAHRVVSAVNKFPEQSHDIILYSSDKFTYLGSDKYASFIKTMAEHLPEETDFIFDKAAEACDNNFNNGTLYGCFINHINHLALVTCNKDQTNKVISRINHEDINHKLFQPKVLKV